MNLIFLRCFHFGFTSFFKKYQVRKARIDNQNHNICPIFEMSLKFHKITQNGVKSIVSIRGQKLKIKILLFSSELGTQSTQDYPDIVFNLRLLGNDRTAHICSAIVVEGHQASEFHILLTKITERLIMYLERLFFSLYIHKWLL